ncbi:hypothetical protein JCM10207_001463 [Rhodosporidiobolus poonsookiae]
MSLFPTSTSPNKRTRDDGEHQPSPGKRIKTWSADENAFPPDAPVHAAPPPTPNFSTCLAQQQQRQLEMMNGDAMDREDVEMGGDEGMIESNPTHPWNATAPRMLHQLSSNSLSTSSGDSSMPPTPSDLPFNEQASFNPFAPAFAQPASAPPASTFPSASNPTAFIDMNGNTRLFSTSPPLSVYPPSAPSAYAQHPSPMPSYTLGTCAKQQTTAGVLRHTGGGFGTGTGTGADAEPHAHVVRELHQPPVQTYGWDLPRQASTLNMGAHLI